MRELWRTERAAEELDATRSSLEKGRMGIGAFATLPFLKLGESVRYEPEIVREWLRSKRVTGAELRSRRKPVAA